MLDHNLMVTDSGHRAIYAVDPTDPVPFRFEGGILVHDDAHPPSSSSGDAGNLADSHGLIADAKGALRIVTGKQDVAPVGADELVGTFRALFGDDHPFARDDVLPEFGHLWTGTREPPKGPPIFRKDIQCYFTLKNSIRRFMARPSAVVFGATGLSGPYPLVAILVAATPFATSHAFTASARACDSFTLVARFPVLSVCPPISTAISG